VRSHGCALHTNETPYPISINGKVEVVCIHEVIASANFGDNRLRHFGMAVTNYLSNLKKFYSFSVGWHTLVQDLSSYMPTFATFDLLLSSLHTTRKL